MRDVSLQPESHPGRWAIVDSTLPDFLDATDIALLTPEGKVFYCHSTDDLAVFDPVPGESHFPQGSGTEQGASMAPCWQMAGSSPRVGRGSSSRWVQAVPTSRPTNHPTFSEACVPRSSASPPQTWPAVTSFPSRSFPRPVSLASSSLGTPATTHWADSGIPRRLVLPVTQRRRFVAATLPSDPNVLSLGFYMVFAMVDD